ncbi:MAG: hypothetical protein OEU74_02630 [Gammaproteobacteria bacterium]|nr:hypothetical protein [Gammaproteobacteria bacterium]
MADLFSMTTPLMIRKPHGEEQIIAEIFPHPEGLVYFDLYWHLGQPNETIHLVEGTISGEGPWKIGEYVINVLGCHGTNAQLATAYQQWQSYLQTASDDYPPAPLIVAIARRLGAITEQDS